MKVEGTMAFDTRFYLAALPSYIQQRCTVREGDVPVLQLHLADGTQLDLCHIVSLADSWFTVAYFRNPEESGDADEAFLPYGLVQWITLAFHPPHVRHIGFDVARSREAALASARAAAGLPPGPGQMSPPGSAEAMPIATPPAEQPAESAGQQATEKPATAP
jgi:hypothetical protein